MRPIRIGIIGDFDASRSSHVATNDSLRHAADALGAKIEIHWIPTPSIVGDWGFLLQYDGLWASPGSPYRDMEGALRAIRFARERNLPFVGT
jgi:CTP synthase (UTP-ammonia lyase)